jgi:hypothetical protein
MTVNNKRMIREKQQMKNVYFIGLSTCVTLKAVINVSTRTEWF